MKMKSIILPLILCLSAGCLSVSAEEFGSDVPPEHMGMGPEGNGSEHMGSGRMGGGRMGGGMGGGRMGGGMNKLTDEQQEVINEASGKFQQLTFEDPSNGIALDYNLYIPNNYDAENTYPLIMFIPDSSASGKSAAQILEQYYGADIWASNAEQEKHPSFVLVPAFAETVVQDNYWTSEQIDTAVHILENIQDTYSIDTDHLYTTGQSMGCMTSLYLNSTYPGLFAASLYVSGQWDISTLAPLENQNFFYITCSGDSKASGGQSEVMDMFDQDGITYSSYLELDPEADQEEKSSVVKSLLAENANANFIRFNGLSHMESFNYAYDLEDVRDWLFEQ